MIVVTYVLVSLGLAFVVISAVGLFRLPDLYTRGHAVAKSETLGLLLTFSGLLFHPATTPGVAARLAVIMAFAMIANPTAVHALLRAAHHRGHQPWTADRRGRE